MGRAAVYTDNSFGGELIGLKSVMVKIIPSARIIGAPVETGVTSFDNKVIDPMKVIVTGVVVMDDDQSAGAISGIKEMMANRDFNFYSVSNGQDCVNNLIMESASSTRESARYDFIEYELVFKQAMLIQSSSVSAGDNSDFQNNGYSSGVAS